MASTVIGVVYSPFFVLKKKSFCIFLFSWLVTYISSEFFGYFKFFVIDVNCINFSSSLYFSRLNNWQSNSTQPPYSYRWSSLNCSIVHSGSPSCTNSTSEHANLIKISMRINFSCRNLRNDRVLAESWASHEMVQNFSVFVGESTGSIWHESASLSGSDFWAKIWFIILTKEARFFHTFWSITGDNNITNFDSSHSGTYALNDCSSLMP